ncbi:ATP synthase F1 subunit delta [Planctomycetota bacterium]
MSGRPAEVYAQSLFEVACDQGVVDQVGDDLVALSTLLDQEPLLLTYLVSPCFTLSQKHGFSIRVFGTDFHGLTRRFLTILIDRRRAGLVPEIIEVYRDRRDCAQGIKPVRVAVAQPLENERLERLEAEISDALQSKIRLTVEVDPSLLGGVLIRCDDQRIDNTLRGRLSRATKTLNEQVKSVTYEG